MGRIKALLAFIIVAGVGYVCYVMGPPYFSNYQFQDDLNQELKFMQNGGKSDDEIKDEIIKKAANNEGIVLSPEQIHITRVGKSMTVEVDYTVHVDIPGYSTDMEFHPTAKNTMVM